MRYICHKSWIGGWFMPQKKSYFAHQLPRGWWLFGLDLSLHCDIDDFQFKFFSEVIQDKVPCSSHFGFHLIHNYLRGRCKLRIAGDLHHYMRHTYVPSEKPVYVQHLLVNGCGGAFLHPTHVFRNFDEAHGTSYECKAAYPSYQDSSRVIILGSLLRFSCSVSWITSYKKIRFQGT